MTEATSRFLLPFILPGQAQKELFHNEALVGIDALLHAAIEDGPLNAPPASPELGQTWLVGAMPTGVWAGQAGKIVTWTEGGWRFFGAHEGTSVWNKAAGFPMRWTGEEWVSLWAVAGVTIGGVQVLGSQQPAILNPSGGTIIDVEARAAIASLIATLQSHGLIE